jgi:hypothetical protein
MSSKKKSHIRYQVQTDSVVFNLKELDAESESPTKLHIADASTE